MKKKILEFEQIEGRKLDLRRLFNAQVNGFLTNSLHGGKKLGEGLEKCVYDSNTNLVCKTKSLPSLKKNEVNVVLSAKAFKEEKIAKQKIVSLLDPDVVKRIFVTLDDVATCTNMKLPSTCTSEAKKAKRIVLTRAQRGYTSKLFKTRQSFGIAVINLVFGLWALHSHGLLHGDVKIAEGANNAVRIGKVYKLIDLGMVMTFDHVRKGIENKQSSQAQELWNMRKYHFWSVGHLYALFNCKHLKKICKKHNISWDRVIKLYIQNIDLVGFMKSLTILVELNPELKLKPLLESLYAKPNDFTDRHEMDARKIIWSSGQSISKSIDLGQRNMINENILDLDIIYKKIRLFCELNIPETIQKFAKLSFNSNKIYVK